MENDNSFFAYLIRQKILIDDTIATGSDDYKEYNHKELQPDNEWVQ